MEMPETGWYQLIVQASAGSGSCMKWSVTLAQYTMVYDTDHN